MSRGNPLIKGTIVNPTSGIREPSAEQRLNEVEKNLAPLGSIEMAGQGERVLQGGNTVIPGGESEPTPSEPTPSLLPSGGLAGDVLRSDGSGGAYWDTPEEC
jgi:hypothetical protein